MSTRSPSTQQRMDHLTALPSLSCSLSSLPQAKGLDQVKLHHPTLASHLVPAQEAKLRKALSVTSQNSANGQQSSLPKTASNQQSSPTRASQPQLMMRPKAKIR